MEKKNGPSKGAIISIVVCCILALCIILGMGSYWFFISGIPFGKVIDNVSAAGVSLGGMTRKEAEQAVQSAVADTFGKAPMKVQIQDQTLTLAPATISELNVSGAVSEAYRYGRTGFSQKRDLEKETAEKDGYAVDVFQYLTVNEAALRRQIGEFAAKFDTSMDEASWKLEGAAPDLSADESKIKPQTLVIHVGTSGRKLDQEDLIQEILKAYQKNQFTLVYDCPESAPQDLDLSIIQKELSSEPQDAVMDKKTFEVTPHVFGYTFDIDAAKMQLKDAKPGTDIRIPFEILPPEITKPQLEQLLFRDVLAKHTATAGSIPGRNVNLKLSCQAINGTVLMPGEVFSYNEALGQRTPERGWKEAAGYVGNKTVNEYGGGICQASSCLYYTAMQADLEIVTRVNHGFISSYMPFGMDATVSWGGPHFRFKNNTAYPIRIEASASGGSVTVALIGTDTKDYYVKMEYEVLKKEDYKVVDVEMEPDNPDGYKDGQVITTPYTGYTIATYRCKYSKEDDSLLSREHEVTSHYSKRDKEICRIVQPETEPVPTEPAPTEPAPTEPAPTEPAPTEPTPTEPTPAEPSETATEPLPSEGSVQADES